MITRVRPVTLACLMFLGGGAAESMSRDGSRLDRRVQVAPAKGVQLAQVSESFDPRRERSYGPTIDPRENMRRYREQNQQRSPFTGRNPAICDTVRVVHTQVPAENYRYMQEAYRLFLYEVRRAGGNQAAPNVVQAASAYWCYAGRLGYSQANPPPFTPERY